MSLSLPDFKQARVLVIGDIMLDRYWNGATSRISPEAPVPVIKVGDIENRLGGAANVAQNLAILGCQTSLCGIIGDDSAGKITQELLGNSSIKNHLVVDKRFPTITKLRVISQHQQLLRLDFEESLNAINKTELLDTLDKSLNDIDVVVISDYAKGTVVDAAPIIKLCKEKNKKILVDPKGSSFERYKGATLVTPNLKELEEVVGKCASIDDIAVKAAQLRKDIHVDALLITLSEKGMMLVTDKEHLHIPTHAQEVFDVTGAGDTVIATMAASLATNTNLADAMRLSNTAAGIVVGKVGTATVNTEELKSELEGTSRSHPRGIVSLEELKALSQMRKAEGERIVFTNGCFDILHAGHVRYLEQAAALGDKLIVAVNSDHSVKRLKGEARPIVPQAERMELLAALSCVDWVVSFDEDTPANLIESLLPDFLVKGGDYIAEEIVGYEAVKKNGGDVIVMPFIKGASTTNIIKKILEAH